MDKLDLIRSTTSHSWSSWLVRGLVLGLILGLVVSALQLVGLIGDENLLADRREHWIAVSVGVVLGWTLFGLGCGLLCGFIERRARRTIEERVPRNSS